MKLGRGRVRAGGGSGLPPAGPLAEVAEDLVLLLPEGHHEGVGGQQDPPVSPQPAHQDVTGAWGRVGGGVRNMVGGGGQGERG